jgi:hypothetical protein
LIVDASNEIRALRVERLTIALYLRLELVIQVKLIGDIFYDCRLLDHDIFFIGQKQLVAIYLESDIGWNFKAVSVISNLNFERNASIIAAILTVLTKVFTKFCDTAYLNVRVYILGPASAAIRDHCLFGCMATWSGTRYSEEGAWRSSRGNHPCRTNK